VLSHAKRLVVIEKSLAVGIGGIVSHNLRMALSGISLHAYTVVAGLGGRAITKASLRGLFERACATSWSRSPSSTSTRRRSIANWNARRRSAAPAPPPRPSCATSPVGGRIGPLGEHDGNAATVKFYQTGTFTVGNRLLDEDAAQRAGQHAAHQLAQLRPPRLPGLRRGARRALRHRRRDARGEQPGIACNATGCLEVFSTPYPETSWQIPWIHSLFGNAAAVGHRRGRGAEGQGPQDVRVIAQGGDGGTTDIGFGCLSGMFERNDDVLYICYDNEAYMNTGVQRSSATPPAARTATTMAVGAEPGNVFGQGKNVPLIAMAHGIPYVATASVAYLRDLEDKVSRAMTASTGARYIHIHVPCPLGWGCGTARHHQGGAPGRGVGPLPALRGRARRSGAGTTPIRHRVPVEEYLKPQKRFAHLFGKTPASTRIARIQEMADRNIRKFGLLARARRHG
jgi:pyruvate ferredoxin oxidoreductase beta subunit